MKDIGIVCSALYIVVYRYPVDVISDQVQYENTSMYTIVQEILLKIVAPLSSR